MLLPLLTGLIAACARAAAPAGAAAAIDAVLSQNPELADRLNGSLPPTTLEAERSEAGGWHVAVLNWGSGRPGILSAECFTVSAAGEVRRTGQFRNRELGSEVRRIDVATCAAPLR